MEAWSICAGYRRYKTALSVDDTKWSALTKHLSSENLKWFYSDGGERLASIIAAVPGPPGDAQQPSCIRRPAVLLPRLKEREL